jgi:hypothetical protein
MFSNNVPQKKGEILKDRLSRILQQMEFMLGELMTRIEKFETRAPFVCWKIVSFWKVNSGKVNCFLMFGSVMENKLENTFQCLVMSCKMSWQITY